MKISINSILFFKQMVFEKTMTLEDWFKLVEDFNLVATEIQHNCVESYDPGYVQQIKQALDRHGLAVSQYIGAPDFTNPDPEYRAAQVRKLKSDIQVASQLGASCVRVTAGQEYPNVSRSEGVGYVVEAFHECLAFAEDHGIWLAYENHYKDYFWKRPDFSQQPDVFLEILNAMKDTPLKVNFDFANPIMIGQDPVPVLREVVDRVVHVHCTDRARFNEYTHAAAGEGLVDYPTLFEILQDAGYDGWLSIEYNGLEGTDGLQRAVDYVRRTWHQVRRKQAKPVVQVSLDVETTAQALDLADKSVRAGVDWIEAGTPLILGEGLHAIQALRKRFPDKPIVADLKTMDGGYLEAEMMAKAGATMVVVMGVAHPATIRAVVRAARDYKLKVMGDILAAPDKVACARMLEKLGVDYIIVHTGYDERRMVRGASPFDDLAVIVEATNVPIQAVGGLSIEQAVECPKRGAPLVVIGAPLAIEADSFAATGDVEGVLRDVVCQVKDGGPR
jgi:3-hexulose-6-phosphate synthase